MQLSLFDAPSALAAPTTISAGDKVEIYLPKFYEWLSAVTKDLAERVDELYQQRILYGADVEDEITRLQQIQIEKAKLHRLVNSFYQPREVLRIDSRWVWMDGLMLPVVCVKRFESTTEFFGRINNAD